MTAWLRLLVLLMALATPAAWAHKPSDSYLSLRADVAGRIDTRWDMALRDLDHLLQLDRDGDGQITWGEVRTRDADIAALAMASLTLQSGGRACEWGNAAPLMLDRHSDGTYAVVQMVARCPALADPITASYSLLFAVDQTHRGLAQWQPPGSGTSQALVFAQDASRHSLALTPPSAWQTLRQYGADGVWHIWIGFDHILFLLALLLPAVVTRQWGRWRPVPRLWPAAVEVTKVVTAFTLAHSLTLALAALGWVSLPSRLVESVIAASVIVAALSNLTGAGMHRRWVMAFGFGLVHGFGFASVLADLGLPAGALALALVGFNAGVELGQLAIVAAFLPVAFVLRATALYRVGILALGSLAIAALAAWWFVQRAFDL